MASTLKKAVKKFVLLFRAWGVFMTLVPPGEVSVFYKKTLI